MGFHDPILDKLIQFTRWPVSRTPSGYTIKCNFDDLLKSRISGIDIRSWSDYPDASCPRLATTEFDLHPIHFSVVQTSMDDSNVLTEFHYYTLGGRLHRNKFPAKYIFRPIQYQSVSMIHFNHGIIDNPEGPAKKFLHGVKHGPVMNTHGYPVGDLQQIDIESVEYEWIINGAKAQYPYPHSASLSGVRMILDLQYQYTDYEDRPGFSALTGTWSWTDRIREKPSSMLTPGMFKMENLREFYQHGKFNHRTADMLESIWWRGDRWSILEQFPPNWILTDLNLWGQPFYGRPESLFYIEDELARYEGTV